MAISIGCGSWTDAAYSGVLYPPGLPASERLSCYATHFDQVEVNSTYYATPPRKNVEAWVKQTPDHFIFNIKLHRVLSQSPGKAVKVPEEIITKASKPKQKPDASLKSDLVANMLEHLDPLIKAGRLGNFLLTLSPFFKPDHHGLRELDGLVEALQPHSLAVEFRNSAWVSAGIKQSSLSYFKERNIAWVCVDMPLVKKSGVMPPVYEVTSPDLAYLRLHGRNKKGYLNGKTAAEKHHYLYKDTELEEIAGYVRQLEKKAGMVRVVANNHAEDFAPRAALQLKKILSS